MLIIIINIKYNISSRTDEMCTMNAMQLALDKIICQMCKRKKNTTPKH